MKLIPHWYVGPATQQARLKRLITQNPQWGLSETEIPAMPNTSEILEDELLLLSIYLADREGQTGLKRTFEELWTAIQPPTDFLKRRDPSAGDQHNLRLIEGQAYTPGIRWVVFNPFAFQGYSSQDAIKQNAQQEGNKRLAGVEVLMSALLLPTWSVAWMKTAPSPAMSALQIFWPVDSSWSAVPTLRVEGSNGAGYGLVMKARMISSAAIEVASPTFREAD